MKKRRAQKGFTLMEVMVGIAIVAIISVPLLNMFATSFKVGRYSYNIDNANAAALRTVENYRSGPILLETMTNVGGSYQAPAQYYNYNWGSTGLENAVFQVNTTITPEAASGMDSAYMPQFVDAGGTPYSVKVSYPAQSAADTKVIKLSLTQSGANYTLTCDPAFLSTGGSRIVPKSQLTSPWVFPVVVDNTQNANGGKVEFQITGMPGIELALFVFGDNEGRNLVSINVTGGGASLTKLTGDTETLSFDQVLIQVDVVRLEDNLVISSYKTNTYVVQ